MPINIFDRLFGPQGAYEKDRELMVSLGLRTHGFTRELTDIGTVTIHDAETDPTFGPRPATTVTVEVAALPTLFWRFTITRPREELRILAPDEPAHPHEFRGSEGRTVAVYEPVERFVMETGSGTFTEYWPMAKAVAQNMMNLEVAPDAE